MKKTIIAGLALFASAATAEPQKIATYGKWTAYKADGVCFAACQPEKSEGNYTRRDDAFLMVSYRPNDNIKGEVSSLLGYKIKKAPAEIVIDGKTKYELQTTEQAAFVDNDVKVVNSMKKGGKLVIHATSSRGTLTTDTYSLKGFTKANEAAAKACQ